MGAKVSSDVCVCILPNSNSTPSPPPNSLRSCVVCFSAYSYTFIFSDKSHCLKLASQSHYPDLAARPGVKNDSSHMS